MKPGDKIRITKLKAHLNNTIANTFIGKILTIRRIYNSFVSIKEASFFLDIDEIKLSNRVKNLPGDRV